MRLRYLVAALAVLFLSGCSEVEEIPHTTDIPRSTELQTTCTKMEEDPEPYLEFPMEDSYVSAVPVGENLLMLSAQGRLSLVSGQDGSVLQQSGTESAVSFSTPDFFADSRGIAYFDEAEGAYILMNPQLQVRKMISLPENIQGKPAISFSNREIYYCQEEYIRALHIDTGISRLVRKLSSRNQQITGAYFDGTLLSCQIIKSNDVISTAFIETATGRTVSDDGGIYALKTYGQNYLAYRMDGLVVQLLYGSRDGTPGALNPQNGAFSALPLNSVVLQSSVSENHVKLHCVDLSTQTCVSELILENCGKIHSVSSDEEFIWILEEVPEKGGTVVHRWNPAAAPSNGKEFYGEKLFTSETPDIEGLEVCRQRADKMGRKYGVQLYLGQETADLFGEKVGSAEYQVSTLQAMLDGLDEAFQMFPSGFFRKTIQGGTVKIGLVRHISTGEPALQYFENGDVWILLSQQVNFPDDFLIAAGSAVDSHVLGNSRKYDNWDSLNPDGFHYDFNLISDENRQDLSLTEGEQRAFADRISMSFPSVERSRILYYAMTDAGSGFFCSEIMQKKLETVCRAIREAYGLEKSEESFLWEQYLQTSLACQQNN